jgi:hypothetical protein
MKTRRAEIIEACERAASTSGQPIIAQMPRMTEFYRKRVNEQLRIARTKGDSVVVADAKAKLGFLRWAEGWMRGPLDTWPTPGSHADAMNGDLSMIGYSLRYLIQAHAGHPRFRSEWRQ